jgi:hypothetical protein
MTPPLHRLDLPARLLVTSALSVLTAGFVVSELFVAQTLRTTGGGLGLRAIGTTFHGDRTTTRLKKMALGSMKRYFSSFEDARRLEPEEQADLDRLLAWSDAGAPESDYWDSSERRRKPGPILRLLQRHGCLDCHSATATTIGNKKDSPLDSYAEVRRFTEPDHGMDQRRLLMLSHVHLLGMGFLFLLLGAAVAASGWPARARAALIVSGPLAVLLTVGGWWLVKAEGPLYAPVVLIGGTLMTLTFGAAVTAVLVDLWSQRSRPRSEPSHR